MKISGPKVPAVIQQVAQEVSQAVSEAASDVKDAFDSAPGAGVVGEALGARAGASAQARAKDGVASLGAEASAGLHGGGSVGKIAVQVGQVGVDGAAAFSGFLGATAGADVAVGVNGARAGGEAFVGAKMGGQVGGTVGGKLAEVGAAVKGEGWVGVGTKSELGVKSDSSGTTTHAEVGAAFGIGGAVGGSVTVKGPKKKKE